MSGSDETFSQSMTSEQLITWLHQQLEEKYKDDIIALTDIFKKNHVDGETFLELTDSDLKGDPFNVESWGLRKKIMKLVEQQKDVESPKLKEKPVLLTSWCSYKVSGTPEEPREPIKDGAQPAVMDPYAKLWHRDPLLVKFKSPELLKEWKITAKQILLWACKWRHDKHNHIPSFRLAEKNDKPDIIIELNMGGNNSSLCGRTTEDTTMWLDLSSDNYRYNEHLVVHEFGHALGLGHEHQRSDFCILVAPFLDESKMKKDLGMRFDHWKADFKLDTSGEKATPYDCHSVMHYWFKTEWLKHGYDNKKKIEDAFHGCQLTEKQRDALLGVHVRAGLVPVEPSQQDLDFVNHVYGMPYVNVIGKTSVKVTKSSQTFEWGGHGFSLHIPADSLPASVDHCVLHICASFSDDYIFPENHLLVSAVYQIYPDPAVEFKQPITLKLQHCARKGLSETLTFVHDSGTHDQDTPPYIFKVLEKHEPGLFIESDEVCCGSIKLSHFSSWAVTIRKSLISFWNALWGYRDYLPILYFKSKNQGQHDIDLAIVWNLPEHIKAADEHYLNVGFIKSETALNPIALSDEEIELDEDFKPNSAWKIELHQTPATLTKRELGWYSPGKSIPHLAFEGKWQQQIVSEVEDLTFTLCLNKVEPQRKYKVRINSQELKVTEEVYFSSKYWKLDDPISVKDFNGKDVLIAILDTHVNKDHVALKVKHTLTKPPTVSPPPPVPVPPPPPESRTVPVKSKVKYERNFLSSDTTNEDHHGTAVAGVAVGEHIGISHCPKVIREKYSGFEGKPLVPLGVAPKASLVVCRVAAGVPSPDCVADALRWIHEHNYVVKNANSPAKDTHIAEGCKLSHETKEENMIRIVSMSFAEFDETRRNDIMRYIEELNNQKVVCVVGAGNAGYTKSLGWLAVCKNVITVGSVNNFGDVSSLSTRYHGTDTCPTLTVDGMCTCVNVYALGENVLLATSSQRGTFRKDSGTSFATPAVAGLIAILVQCAREQDHGGSQLVERITHLPTLMKFFKTHFLAATNPENVRILQPERIEGFFKGKQINNRPRKECEKIHHLKLCLDHLDKCTCSEGTSGPI